MSSLFGDPEDEGFAPPDTSQSSGGTRGGSSEQHAAAGRQSHKNDKG